MNLKSALTIVPRKIYRRIENFSSICPIRKPNSILESIPVDDYTYCIRTKNTLEGAWVNDKMFPNYYTKQIMHHVPDKAEHWTVKIPRIKNGVKKGDKEIVCEAHTPGAIYHPFVPAHYEPHSEFADHYYVDRLLGNGKGSGTFEMQETVLSSIKDRETRGRVLLKPACIDGKTYPAGFYYKLGFRSNVSSNNEMLEQWLISGGKRENSPACYGTMYLPKENIMHCLKYGNTTYSLKDRFLITYYLIRNKILEVMKSK